MKPFFSIVIPLYNKERHIHSTLKSVLAQTFNDFEIIVVNDGSTDNGEAEVVKIKDKRLKLSSIENKGVSYARNFGVEKAESSFIVLLDADDLWKPNHLEDLKRLQKQFPNCGLYATAYDGQYKKKIITSEYNGIAKKIDWSGIVPDFFDCSKINCIASASSVMIPKDVYKKLGGFNTVYDSGEDVDFWIRIALNYPVAFINKTSALINMTADNQVSRRSVNTRHLLDLDAFKEEKSNQTLKTYLDLNRFSLAIQHKLVGNNAESEALIKKINFENLNSKQRFLLRLNTTFLKKLVKVKNVLRKNGIALSAFR